MVGFAFDFLKIQQLSDSRMDVDLMATALTRKPKPESLCQFHHIAEAKVLRCGNGLLEKLLAHRGLFNRHRLCQSPRLVHITTAAHGDVIGEQL